MKTTRSWIPIAAAVAILVAILGYLVIPGSEVQAKTKSVVGSWNVEVTVVKQNATIPGLLTFSSDGNVFADETPSPLETSGHGNWVRTRANKGAYTFVFLIGSTEPGQWLKGTVSGTVEYDADADQWNGPFTISVVDQDGNEVLSDTGTMSSTRITARP